MVNISDTDQEAAFFDTPRGTHKQATQAMGGDVMRGLIETVTNVDDSYSRLEGLGEQPAGSILIEIERSRSGNTIIVKDRAEGMSYQEMMTKLREKGAKSSGFQEGANVRGNLGFGVKDLVGLGRFQVESIKGEWYSCFSVNADTMLNRDETKERRATPEDKKRLGVRSNGTCVTMHINRQLRFPNREHLEDMIRNHFALRLINQSDRRQVRLKDSTNGDSKPITYLHPKREEVFNSEITFQDYSSDPESNAHLVIYRNEEMVSKPATDPTRPSGILIQGRKAIYENTLFSFERLPMAHHFSGILICPHIDKLAREYDERRDAKEDQLVSNPFDIISRTRQGLEPNHPFRQAIQKAITPILDELIKKEEAAIDNETKLSRSMKAKFSNLGRLLANQMDRDLRNSDQDALPPTTNGSNAAEFPDLSLIPPHLLFLEGETKTLTVRIREGVVDVKSELEVRIDPSDALEVISTSIFKAHPKHGGFSTAQIRLRAGSDLDQALIDVKCGELQELATATIAYDVEDVLIEDLQFERKSIQIRVNRRKQLSLYIPTELYDEHDGEPQIFVSNPEAFNLNTNSDVLFNEDFAVYEKVLSIEGKRLGESGTLTAQFGNKNAVCKLKIGQDESQSNVDIKITNKNEGFYRAQLDTNNGLTCEIFAGHPIAKSCLGAPPEYPGAETERGSILLAEIMATEIAEYMLERVLQQYDEMDASAYNSWHKEFVDRYLSITYRVLVNGL